MRPTRPSRQRQVRRPPPQALIVSQAEPLPPTRLPDSLLERIERDPVFQVMTDNLFWIDPFSGEPVAAQEGRVEAASAHLLETGAWQFGEPMTRQELEVIRWRYDLVPRLKEEPRLRLFARDGRWVNPYTGELVEGVRRENGQLNDRSLLDLARILAGCPQAANGLMLDFDTLRSRARAATGRQASGDTGSHVAVPQADPMGRARNVQQWMLSALPRIDGYELAVHYAPCSAVGGDFYDELTLATHRRLFVVGDVSGHGVEAALVVASALSALRLMARDAQSAVDLLGRFNQEIGNDLMPGQFITLFAAEIDTTTHEMTCICAGHHAGLLLNLDGEVVVRRVGNLGMAVGLASTEIFLNSLRPVTVALQGGDVLLQYTDGIVEAQDGQRQVFGDARLYGVSCFNLTGTMQELVDAVARAALGFSGGQMQDDVTVFAMTRLHQDGDRISTAEWVWPFGSG